MTVTEIVIALVILLNAVVMIIEMRVWLRYMSGIDKEIEADKYMKSEQFQIDKAKRLDETYKVLKEAELLCKTHKSKNEKRRSN